MTSTTVVGAVSGLVLGGLLGGLAGRSLEKKGRMERGVATELGVIFGGMAGAVTAAAVVTPKATPMPA